jgi:hypothetical protein
MALLLVDVPEQELDLAADLRLVLVYSFLLSTETDTEVHPACSQVDQVRLSAVRLDRHVPRRRSSRRASALSSGGDRT